MIAKSVELISNNMSGFLKKWETGHKTARVAIAVAYLFAIIATPLSHTCELGKACSKHSHFGNSGHHCSGEFCTNLRFDVALKQNNCAPKALSNQDLCMACLYSIVSKSTQINTGAALVSIEVSTSSQILPLSRVVKQSAWFSSIFLRAPPCINS
jgi:hypothetical protein